MSEKTVDKHYLIITDLDGTLLDHHNYTWQAAQPALDLLAEHNIPVVINTSKTAAEVISLQASIGLNNAFIVENGSAIFIPDLNFVSAPPDMFKRNHHWVKLLGKEKNSIVKSLQDIRKKTPWKFEGFSDWTVEKIIAETGLPYDAAIEASLREFSEPIVWRDSKENYQQFCHIIHEYGLKILKGGRFIHILGNTDKGIASSWLKTFIEIQNKTQCTLVALGDGPNDIDMLNASDIAVVVKSPAHNFPTINRKEAVIFTQAYGPEGWNEAINTLKSIIT